MNKIVYILLFISSSLTGQTEKIQKFYPLSPIDTITESKKVRNIERIDNLNKNSYFFTDEYNNEDGFFFIKQSQQIWVVYDFELRLNYGSNVSLSEIQSKDDGFISIQIYRSPSGGCSNIYGTLILLDSENCKSIGFANYNRRECYNENGEITNEEECKASLETKNGYIEIKSTKRPDDGLTCIETSKYKIQEDKLVKSME